MLLMLVLLPPSLAGLWRSLRKSELVHVLADDGAGGMEDRPPAPLHLSEKTFLRGGSGGGFIKFESPEKLYMVDAVDVLDIPKSSAPKLNDSVFGGKPGGGNSLPPSAIAQRLHAAAIPHTNYALQETHP